MDNFTAKKKIELSTSRNYFKLSENKKKSKELEEMLSSLVTVVNHSNTCASIAICADSKK